jgi:hypothetical protein
MRNYS